MVLYSQQRVYRIAATALTAKLGWWAAKKHDVVTCDQCLYRSLQLSTHWVRDMQLEVLLRKYSTQRKIRKNTVMCFWCQPDSFGWDVCRRTSPWICSNDKETHTENKKDSYLLQILAGGNPLAASSQMCVNTAIFCPLATAPDNIVSAETSTSKKHQCSFSTERCF